MSEPEIRTLKSLDSSPHTYIVKRDGLHHLVMLHRIHFIKVSISDENCTVLHLIKAIYLEKRKFPQMESHELLHVA